MESDNCKMNIAYQQERFSKANVFLQVLSVHYNQYKKLVWLSDVLYVLTEINNISNLKKAI